ncbi:MAG: MarC family protein [Steroidobacteraceae bacterium]
MIDELIKFFVLLFVVVEPITLAPVFASLTQGADDAYRRRMSFKAILISLIVLVVCALAGGRFIQLMGISIDAFRIAGGAMLFLISLEMVFARESGTKTTQEEKAEVQQRADISVFPLAFPFIAGPGALATVLLTFSTTGDNWQLTLGLLGVIAVVLAITLVVLLLTPFINRVMGVTGAHVVSRLTGVVLAALAVQFILNGLRGAFA